MPKRTAALLIALLAVFALAAGTVGFRQCDSSTSFATALYRSIQLFYWNYFPWNVTTEATLPWTLELARWLAPLATLGALVTVSVALFQRRWAEFRACRLRHHVVISGVGEKGLALARDLRRKGSRLVLIEQDADRAGALRAEGFLVIEGDAASPGVQRRAAVAQAAKLVVATADDHRNLAIALASRAPLSFAHSGNSALCDHYQRHCAAAGRLRVFNVFRNVARSTIREFPPESPTGEVHVVLPGLAGPGLALAVEYALMGQLADERRIHLHLVSPQATRELEILQNLHPGMTRCATLSAIPLPGPEFFSSRVAAEVTSQAGTFTIFPCLEDGDLAFARALELLDSTGTSRLLLPASETSPIRSVVRTNPALNNRIAFLPLPEETSGSEAVLGESLDRLARLIHENWLRETQRQITAARALGDETLARRHESKATFKAWEVLSEEQKGASRSQADHIPFKIRAAGLDPKFATRSEWAQLTSAQIERLARMEHARWAAYYWMTGWTFAPERDDEKKHHPDLVSYEQLDEFTKDYDRQAVVKLGGFLI